MVEMKRCSGECGLEKELNEDNFPWRNDNKKFRNECKICLKKYKKEHRIKNIDAHKERDKKYYKENREKILEYQKQWRRNDENKNYMKQYLKEYYQENKDEILAHGKEHYQENKKEILEHKKQHYQENKDEIRKKDNIYRKNRRKNDLEYKLHKNISRSVHNVLKHKKGGQSVLKHLPYTMEELRKHIENQFKKSGNEWMTWDNWGVYNPKTHETNRTWQLDHITAHSKFKYKDMKCKEFQDCWALSNLQPLDSRENIAKGNK